MLNIIFKAIILGLVLFAAHYGVGLLVAAFALPTVITTVVAVLFILGFGYWVLKAFGITF